MNIRRLRNIARNRIVIRGLINKSDPRYGSGGLNIWVDLFVMAPKDPPPAGQRRGDLTGRPLKYLYVHCHLRENIFPSTFSVHPAGFDTDDETGVNKILADWENHYSWGSGNQFAVTIEESPDQWEVEPPMGRRWTQIYSRLLEAVAGCQELSGDDRELVYRRLLGLVKRSRVEVKEMGHM